MPVIVIPMSKIQLAKHETTKVCTAMSKYEIQKVLLETLYISVCQEMKVR